MNGRIALPYLTLSDAAVNASPWVVSLNGSDSKTLGDYLPNWDTASKIRLQRDLRVDINLAAQELAVLKDGLVMSLRTRIGTGPGRLPRVLVLVKRLELPASGESVVMEIDLEGEKLSAVLDLFTEIVLIQTPLGGSELSPAKSGHRVWHDRQRIRIEGEEQRFPIEVADFRSLLGTVSAADAPWYLHWSPKDWSRDFHGAIRLFLNKESHDFVSRIEAQDGPTLQALLSDVMSQVCERFIAEHADSDGDSHYESGTLGAQALSWLTQAWPGRDLGFIGSVLQNRTGEFRSAFLALAETSEVDL